MLEGHRLARLLRGAALGFALVACSAGSWPPCAATLPPALGRSIPPRPLPPAGAVAGMAIPARDARGVRQTVNADLTAAQTVWNLRAALNVAALNCREANYQPLLDSYKGFLERHAKALAAADRAVDEEFRRKHGNAARRAQDAYTTKVYNYFALPPVLPDLCEAALAVGIDLPKVAPAGLERFAGQALPHLEQVFETFFRRFEQYRADAAAWDARYRYRTGAGPVSATAPSAGRNVRDVPF